MSFNLLGRSIIKSPAPPIILPNPPTAAGIVPRAVPIALALSIIGLNPAATIPPTPSLPREFVRVFKIGPPTLFPKSNRFSPAPLAPFQRVVRVSSRLATGASAGASAGASSGTPGPVAAGPPMPPTSTGCPAMNLISLSIAASKHPQIPPCIWTVDFPGPNDLRTRIPPGAAAAGGFPGAAGGIPG